MSEWRIACFAALDQPLSQQAALVTWDEPITMTTYGRNVTEDVHVVSTLVRLVLGNVCKTECQQYAAKDAVYRWNNV